MFLDSQLQFSDDQALTATVVSTNDIDLGVDQNIGKGEPMGIVIVPSVAADIANADEIYQFDLLTDNDVAFGSPTILSSRIIDGEQLKVGDSVVIPIGHFNEQYLRLNYVLGGTDPAVTVSAYLQPMAMIDGRDDYPDGFDVT